MATTENAEAGAPNVVDIEAAEFPATAGMRSPMKQVDQHMQGDNRDVVEVDDDDDQDNEGLGQSPGAPTPAGDTSSPSTKRSKQNRLEKKSRRVLSRLGLKPVTGINKVTIKKSKHLLFSITNPEVFKSPTSDVYVIFGDAKLDDTAAAASNKVAAHFNVTDLLNSVKSSAVAAAAASSEAVPPSDSVQPLTAEELPDTFAMPGAEEGVDAQLSEGDVLLLMQQSSCSRAEAIAMLKKHNYDLVDSIMELTETKNA